MNQITQGSQDLQKLNPVGSISFSKSDVIKHDLLLSNLSGINGKLRFDQLATVSSSTTEVFLI